MKAFHPHLRELLIGTLSDALRHLKRLTKGFKRLRTEKRKATKGVKL